MKGRILAIMCLILALVLVALVAAQTSNDGSSGTTSASQGSTTSQKTEKSKKLHLPPSFSADEAYKQNCTRCHAEVPPVSARRTKTIVRHMRVRANLTADEAQAILQYLTQ